MKECEVKNMNDDTNTYNKVTTPDKKPAKQENNKKKIIIIVGSVIGFIALAVGIFYAAYYAYIGNSYSTYENNLKSCISKINAQNSKTAELYKGTSLNLKTAKKGLSGIIDKLSDVKDNINSVTPPDKYRAIYKNLSDGLDNNISMYRAINDMLGSSNFDDTSLSTAAKYRDDCMKYYSDINYKDININLTDDSITFVNNALKYLTNLYKTNKDKEIKQNQNTDYLNSMDSIINNFTSLKTDFSGLTANARSGSQTYDDVLSAVDKNSQAVQALSQSLDKVTLPSDKASDVNDAVKKAVDDYSTYLQNFKYALTNEKAQAQNGPVDSATLTQFYADSDASFSTFNDDFNNMIKVYSDYKAATAAQ